MPGIGFSLQAQYSLPLEQVIELLKAEGFCAVSPPWSPDPDLEAIATSAQKHSMAIQSIHASHNGIQLLWDPDSALSVEVQNNTIRCVDACARFSVPVMVLHCWKGFFYTFPKAPLDFRFFDRLVDYAQQKGVSIALENLEGEEYLDALMMRYPHIGFCWDSGHDHCYPHKLDFLEKFGHRLIMTHLNDNLGVRDPSGIPSANDDLHFLPYDGSTDWAHTLRKLKAAAPQAILNFEFKTQSHSKAPEDLIYAQLPLETFLHTAGQRARGIAQLYDTISL